MLKKVTVSEALSRASFYLRQAGIEQPRIEAELLLSYLLGQDRITLTLNNDGFLEDDLLISFDRLLQRRGRQEPIAYITGIKHFYGRPFDINPAVLIPRPETELIIERAVSYFRKNITAGKGLNCLDIGTGSGILAVTLTLELPAAKMWAIDISETALKVAEGNAEKLGVAGRICFSKGNYFQALKDEPGLSFDLIVANPPYVDKQGMVGLPDDVSLYEPESALFGGEDGLDGYRMICAGLKEYLKRPGLVLFEIGETQQDAVEELCLATGLFSRVFCHKDLAGKPRVLECC